jgi:tRNA 2-thiouridine synthesizing protein A
MPGIKVDLLLDTKGMVCPLPVIKTKKAIDTLQSGQLLEVTVTDRRSQSDIPTFLKRLGHELLLANEERGVVKLYIRKK